MPKMEDLVKKTDVLTIIRLGKKRIDKRMAVIPMITIFPEMADSSIAMADSLGQDDSLGDEEKDDELKEKEGTEDGVEEGENDLPNDNQNEEKDAEKSPDNNQEIGEEEELPKVEKAAPKPKKKLDAKDPELSDPSMKAEFEESFEDEPKDDDFFDVPPPPEDFEEPVKQTPKKKKGAKKNEKNSAPVKKEEAPEPEPEDDKF